MLRTLRVVAIVLLVSVLAAPAWAQVQTGSILVKVVDDQGASIPGLTVTVTSPVLPQPLVGVTDSAGTKNFTALTVGTSATDSVEAPAAAVDQPASRRAALPAVARVAATRFAAA